MTLHPFDHLFFLVVAVVFPITERFAARKRAALVNAGRTELRMKSYRSVHLLQWPAIVVLVSAWFWLGRSAADLGLAWTRGTVVWVGYGLTALFCIGLLLQARRCASSEKRQASFRDQVGWLSFMMPRTPRERRAFYGVAITAGICEEIVYRGFVIFYLAHLLQIPFWGGALLSAVVFGVAHMYQGPKGSVQTGSFGLGMAVLYVLTGALWAPMIAHMAMDFAAGYMGHASFSGEAPDGAPEPTT